MGENRVRRQARRQKRGVLRAEEILQAAGALFVERGYDAVTIHMIATRAGVSPGSLYQFFPNREAITRAFAANAAERLHRVYDAMLSSEAIALPLHEFLDAFIDRLMVFNRDNPGYLALQLGSTISPSLRLVLADLHRGLLARQDSILASYWPQSTPEQRQIPLLVSYRIFLALLPLALRGEEEHRGAIVREMKVALYRYLEQTVSG